MTSAIRLRRLIAEDEPLIVGYDGDEFARRLHYADRPIVPALAAVEAARATTAQILHGLTEAEWARMGTHSDSGTYGVQRHGSRPTPSTATITPTRSTERSQVTDPSLDTRRALTASGSPITDPISPARVAPREPPKSRRRSARRRRRPGRGPRHADEVADAEAPPRALRPADGRLRRRRRPRGDRRAARSSSRRPATAAVRDALGDDVDYALQAEPRGTGDAVAAAARGAPRRRRRGPRPHRRRAARSRRRCSTSSSRSAASTRPRSRSSRSTRSSPGDLGRVVRDEAGTVERIVERKDATDEELAVNEINSGLYAFDAALAAGADRLAPARRRRPASCT